MKPIISLERRDAILALSNKRTQAICALMENNHVDDFYTILRLVDRPAGTPEEIRNTTEALHIEQLDKWYDLIANACRWLQNLNLTMTDHVPVYWYDAETQSMVWDYADELVFCIDEQETPYKGQKLVDSVDEIIPVILKPLMDEAIAEMNASNINQLAAAKVYVIGMSIKQERENG